MQSELGHLHTLIHVIAPLPDAVWQDFAAVWQPFDARRKTILTAAGETEKYLYFVVEGVQRAYALREDGKESTLVFTYPYSFSGVADSFLLQQPSRYFFETLTPSRFLRTTFRQIDELLLKHPALERLFRLAVSQTLSGVLTRQVELQSLSAEQRLRAFFSRSPHLFQLIPHKYLAEYLGMDATNFSKFLGQIRFA